MMRALLTVVLTLTPLVFALEGEVPISSCFVCASPYLKGRWDATGLPINSIDAASYSPKCADPTNKNLFLVKPCQGLCFEMMFPLDGIQQVVRGCYQDFFKDKPVEMVITGSEAEIPTKCIGQQAASNNTIVFKKDEGSYDANTAINAVSFCDDSKRATEAVPVCNTQLTIADNVADFKIPSPLCKKPDTVKCRKCKRIGSEGKCSSGTKDYVDDGAVCTKIDGTIESIGVIARDTQIISPMLGIRDFDSYCYDYDEKTTGILQLSGMTIEGPLKGKKCVCGSDECNPASTLRYPFLAVVLGLIAALHFR